jgi:hypothetical protein
VGESIKQDQRELQNKTGSALVALAQGNIIPAISLRRQI